MLPQRKPNRLRGYDYSRDNLYFITSCVKNRICCFGKIVSGEMILNEYGTIAQQQWHWLKQQFPYVVLHAFVVMPNHVHAIIEFNRAWVGTNRDLTIKIKSLSELMGAYKTTTSKKIHLTGNAEFAWQRSFHDHIIRNEKAFKNISKYIMNNQAKWNEDDFFE